MFSFFVCRRDGSPVSTRLFAASGFVILGDNVDRLRAPALASTVLPFLPVYRFTGLPFYRFYRFTVLAVYWVTVLPFYRFTVLPFLPFYRFVRMAFSLSAIHAEPMQ